VRKIIFTLVFINLAGIGFAQKFPDSNTDGKFYTVNGAKIWTVTVGTGDPVFIIPGGPGGAHPGMRGFDSLYNTNTLVYFDAFGRGKSDTAKDVKEYSIKGRGRPGRTKKGNGF
jgi:proline iminopeptidase